MNFVKCAMSTKYGNDMKIEPQHERLPKIPRVFIQVQDYDTFLIHFFLRF